MRSTRRSVAHHDLWHDNLLVDETGALAGVLEFVHLEITDPAHDVAAPHLFGPTFVEHLLAAYRHHGGHFTDEERHRMHRYWEAWPLGGLAWAIDHDDRLETAAAIRRLRAGPILRGAGSGAP
ncbi:MAG: hypothetical protein FJZ92_08995 [Chloroflexi bacterium]|nr:hypothetical protein [Chloroflexota bacterium]